MRGGPRDNTRSAAPGIRSRWRLPMSLAMALPLVIGLLTLGVGFYAFEVGRSDATSALTSQQAIRVWTRPPDSWLWLFWLTGFGALIGLSVALAFTRQLRTLARRTEFLARRNFSFPVDLQADGEVAPLVAAINDLIGSVRDYARHSIADGVISFSREGRVLALNPRAAVALGVDTESVLGGPFRELIPAVAANAALLEAFETAFEHSIPFDLKGVTWVNARGRSLGVDLQGTVLAGKVPIISVLVVFDESFDLEEVQRQVSRAQRLLIIGGFAAELAHEIRNPLSSVLGLVELLHERLPADDPGHRHLKVLNRAAERIEGLVSQLLELVPTETHELVPCDPNVLVRQAVELARSAPNALQVEVRQRYATDLPLLRIDPQRLPRAVDNLLRNAFNHTPAGGSVSVVTRLSEAGIDIEIANTGSYIAPHERGRIFQPFVSGRCNGTGLGLTIAQQIVYAHGGSVRVASDPEEGTVFTVQLPVSAALEDATEIVEPLHVPMQIAAASAGLR